MSLKTEAWLEVSASIGHWDTDSSNMSARAPLAANNPTWDSIRQQFSNPSGIVSVLLLLGGDTIQKAVAQMTGPKHYYFTPVAFSLGWVSYAFNSVANAVGDGIFLPAPDYPTMVISVDSGDKRENRSWVIGRLVRDLEILIERQCKHPRELDSGLVVTVFKAHAGTRNYGPRRPKKDWFWFLFCITLLVQVALAIVPVILHQNWYILIISVAGNILAICNASLGTMRKEKYQGSKNSPMTYALTRGNGHKHVFIIIPDTLLREHEAPRRDLSSLIFLDQMASGRHRADNKSRLFSIILAVLWVVLLVLVAGLDQDTWFLVAAGSAGMVYNLCASSSSRTPEAHGIPIVQREGSDGKFGRREIGADGSIGLGPKVMATLIELEKKFPGAGHSLRPIFFPGRLKTTEKEAWNNVELAEDTIVGRRAERRRVIYDGGRWEPSGNEERAEQELNRLRDVIRG